MEAAGPFFPMKDIQVVTRRNHIESRLQALEARAARRHQPQQPSMWARYWSAPVPSLAEIFGDQDPKLLPPNEVWAWIEARLPPMSEEFMAMTPEQVHVVYRQEIARQKAVLSC